MTEKLLTGTLSLNTTNQPYQKHVFNICFKANKIYLKSGHFFIGQYTTGKMLSIVWLCHLFSLDFWSEQNCFKAHKNAYLFHFLQPLKQISAFTDAVGTAW